MTAHDPALVEKARQALEDRRCVPMDEACRPCENGAGCVALARAVLDAVVPAVREEALNEAAETILREAGPTTAAVIWASDWLRDLAARQRDAETSAAEVRLTGQESEQ